MRGTQLTKEGLEQLKKEQTELKEIKRPYAVDRLQKARGMGDLSENSEYSAAKEELSLLEGRLQEIDEIIKNAQVVEENNNGQVVALGCKVDIEYNGVKDTYHVVGEYEADPMKKKLSITSPLGKALIGQRKGDVIEVNAPAGKINYKILEIQ